MAVKERKLFRKADTNKGGKGGTKSENERTKDERKIRITGGGGDTSVKKGSERGEKCRE